jgi:hypothetical protein
VTTIDSPCRHGKRLESQIRRSQTVSFVGVLFCFCIHLSGPLESGNKARPEGAGRRWVGGWPKEPAVWSVTANNREVEKSSQPSLVIVRYFIVHVNTKFQD